MPNITSPSTGSKAFLSPRAFGTQDNAPLETIVPNALPQRSPMQRARVDGVPSLGEHVATLGLPSHPAFVVTQYPYVRIFDAVETISVLIYCRNSRNNPFIIAIKYIPGLDTDAQTHLALSRSGRISQVTNVLVVAGGDPLHLDVQHYILRFQALFPPPTVVGWIATPPCWRPQMTWDVITNQAGSVDLISRGWANVHSRL